MSEIILVVVLLVAPVIYGLYKIFTLWVDDLDFDDISFWDDNDDDI